MQNDPVGNDQVGNDQLGIGHNPEHRGGFLLRIADFVLAYRRPVMTFWLLLFLVGVGMAIVNPVEKRLSTDFSLPGEPGYEVASEINKQYGNGGEAGNSLLVIAAPAGQTVDSAQPQIKSGIDAVRAKFPQLRVVDYASTGDRSFITNDNKTTYAMLFAPLPTSFSQLPVSKEVAESIEQSIPNSKVTGLQELSIPDSEAQEDSGVFRDTMIAAAGALVVLAYVFASFLALIPLMIAAVSILTTLLIVLGVTYIADVSFIVFFLVSLVGLGVAIDYSLLVVTRWREELSKGAENNDAIRTAMATSGHAVLLSGLAVAIGLVALVVLPVPSLRSTGYGGMLIPLISTIVTLTLLPAILGGFGKKMNWPRVRQESQASRAWTSWARVIVKYRWVAAIVSTAVLIVMILPVKDLKIGQTTSAALAKSGPAFDAYKSLSDGGVPSGVLTPAEVLTTRQAAPQVVARLRSVDGIASAVISDAPDSNKGDTTVVLAIPTVETTDSSTTKPVERARDAIAGIPGVVGVTGSGAIQLDYLNAVFGNAPLVFFLIAVITFLLLTRAFHSVVLAIKALLLNVLSLAAIFGVVTWFWQQGHGSESIFNVQATGAITYWIPTMIFAFLFGLSMDYEVFILARMREEYDRSGSTTGAVIVGIGRTGRLVTSAALILFMSFASLALAGPTDLKVLATGLGAGILLDATIVRAFLLPALVALFGEWNWWMPKSLATLLRTEVPAKANVGTMPDRERV